METNEFATTNITEQPVKKNGWKAIVVSLFIIIMFLGIQVIGGVIGNIIFTVKLTMEDPTAVITEELLVKQIAESGFMTNLLLVVTMFTTLLSALWYYFGYVKKNAVVDMEAKLEWKNPKMIISLVFAAVACYSIDALICGVINLVSPSTMEHYTNLMNMALGGSAVVSVITTVVLAPIGEEALLRGVIFRKIAKSNKMLVAIIAQAVLFGVYHANIVQGIYTIVMGLLLGYIAYKFGSILPCILVHAVNNLVATLIPLLPETLGNSDMNMVIIFLGMSLISVLILFVLNKDLLKKQK